MDIKELLKHAMETPLTSKQMAEFRKTLEKQAELSERHAKASSSTEFLNRTYSI